MLGKFVKTQFKTILAHSFAKTKAVNVALIGLGRAGIFHMNSMTALSGVNCKYVMDTDQDLVD